MITLDLCLRHSRGRTAKILATSIAGGVLGAGTVAVTNFVSAGTELRAPLAIGIGFLAAIGIMFVCNRWSARALVEVFEDVQRQLRADLSVGIRQAPLRRVEQLGADRGRVINDLTTASTGIVRVVMLIQNAAFLGCVTAVIATISGKALLIWVVTVGAITRFLVPGLRRLGDLQAAQSGRGGAFHAHVDELLDGFQQLKLDVGARRTVIADIRSASATLYGGQVDVADETYRTFLTAQALFYSLGFGLAVFAPASTVGLGPAKGYEMSILLSLSLGPLFSLLEALPIVVRTEAALSKIVDVLDSLRAVNDQGAGHGGGDFEDLYLDRVSFTYPAADGSDAFTVGPIELGVKRGDLVLVTGGNGSGKTTLMKMLLGLYPISGRIRWNERVVAGDRLTRYRGLYTAIFGGQFLFDRPYGINAPAERIDALLERFGIAHVVQFDGERFGRLDLSSGQRMRLAMVVALLEDRPICVFDEWTANQDPETTWMYYDVLLPELIAQGKTVIAVSHDDRFFDRADHLIQLDEGRVIVDRRGGEG